MKETERIFFQQKIAQYKEAGQPIIYVDESGFSHDMPRTHGYAPKGKRCFGKHAWGAKGRTNVIGALWGTRLLTACLFHTTINTDIFCAWILKDLLPKIPPQSVIVMDNATFHKNKQMQNQIERLGYTLEYLPPYSPDLNPIEHKWAQKKSQRRKENCSLDTLFNCNIS